MSPFSSWRWNDATTLVAHPKSAIEKVAAIVSPKFKWQRPLTTRRHQKLKGHFAWKSRIRHQKMATLVCAPFSKWRHTPKSLASNHVQKGGRSSKMATCTVTTKKMCKSPTAGAVWGGSGVVACRKCTIHAVVTVVHHFKNGVVSGAAIL